MEKNKKITQEIIAIILEEINGYSKEEAIQNSKYNNGEVEERIKAILDTNYPEEDGE